MDTTAKLTGNGLYLEAELWTSVKGLISIKGFIGGTGLAQVVVTIGNEYIRIDCEPTRWWRSFMVYVPNSLDLEVVVGTAHLREVNPEGWTFVFRRL